MPMLRPKFSAVIFSPSAPLYVVMSEPASLSSPSLHAAVLLAEEEDHDDDEMEGERAMGDDDEAEDEKEEEDV